VSAATARLNPFATDRIAREIPYDPAWHGTTWEQILETLAAHRHRVHIAGPHGSGKTTLLDALAPRLADAGHPIVRWLLTDEKPAASDANWALLDSPSAPLLIIDGAERLRFRDWRRLARLDSGLSGLVVTTHRPIRRLPLLLRTRSTSEMLAAFIQTLAPDFSLSAAEVEHLHADTRGNLREALWRCYDRAGDLTGSDRRPNPV
jgi:hypothetical protein